MALFKCKMCGGELELQPNSNIAECLYCGSKQTVPNADNDKKLRLYNRANQYRLDNEFEKAYNAYESIIAEKEDESEAYWGLVLSEYGVEYVEDPVTQKRIPTCHRTLVKSVTSNENYKLACKYADSESRMMYEDEAEALDSLQKKILTAASKEEPYDVFICYKETDANGDRTPDSVLAQEIYDELTKHGFRVFFSRISLEDKLGKDYEPCIYAALTSAKVMLMVTTDSEHCNAVWVKNEWKRFIDFMKNDSEKVLIPVYRDISPYALPDEFAKLQAQDMSKLGAVQDLVHGIKKILGKGRNASTGGLDAHEKKLLEKIEKNEKRKGNFLKIAVIGVATLILAAFFSVVTNTYPLFYMKGIPVYIQHIVNKFGLIILAVVLAFDIALFINWTKGIRSKAANTIYLVIFVLFSIVLMVGSVFAIFPALVLKFVYIAYALFAVLAAAITFGKEKKKQIISMGGIVVLFGLTMLMCGSTPTQSNGRDESKVQIKVEHTTLNVRESSTTNSKRLSVVNKGDIFTVLDVEESSEYTWYKITTNLGVTGYVAAGKQHEYVTLLTGDTLEMQTNARDTNVNQIKILDDNIVLYDTASKTGTIVGRVYADDIYTVTDVKYEKGLVWYGITTSNAISGYVCTSTVSDTVEIEELLVDRISFAGDERNENVWQIKVIEEYRNLRELPESGSQVIGKVKQDEIYTVVDVVYEDSKIWYQISLNGDIEGYLYAMDRHQCFEYLPANADGTGQGNEPNPDKEQFTVGYTKALYEQADRKSDILGFLLEDEVYDILNKLEIASDTWYEVETNYGLHGYVKK